MKVCEAAITPGCTAETTLAPEEVGPVCLGATSPEPPTPGPWGMGLTEGLWGGVGGEVVLAEVGEQRPAQPGPQRALGPCAPAHCAPLPHSCSPP